MKQSEIKHYLDLYKEGRFAWITENILKVDGNEVIRHLRKNSHYLSCSCQSSGSTGNSSLCRHKTFFILFPFLEKFFTKLEILQDEYKAGESTTDDEKVKTICHQIWNDLKSLEELK